MSCTSQLVLLEFHYRTLARTDMTKLMQYLAWLLYLQRLRKPLELILAGYGKERYISETL